MAEYYTQDFTDLRINGDGPKNEVDKCIPRFFSVETLRGEELVRIEQVEIITPGDRLSRPVQKVTDHHRQRWPRQYQAFRSGLDTGLSGTPIATWDVLSWQMQNDMRALGFQTVEQLAEAGDGQLDGVPNGMLWRKKAQIHIGRNNVIGDKDKQIAELNERLAKLEAANVSRVLPESGADHAPAKRGRRPGSKNTRKAGDKRGRADVAGTVGTGRTSDAAT